MKWRRGIRGAENRERLDGRIENEEGPKRPFGYYIDEWDAAGTRRRDEVVNMEKEECEGKENGMMMTREPLENT